eukprot:5280839-Pyramimonas_sp.AAC.4
MFATKPVEMFRANANVAWNTGFKMTRTLAFFALILAAQWHGGEASLEDMPEWIACEENPEGCTRL